jgi:hypothetical protein
MDSVKKISTHAEMELFEKYLSKSKRIFFSAPFGSGKTTFIHDFFEEDTSTKYYPVRLSPVSYSVANNTDVFELIKADILFHIIPEIDIEKVDISHLHTSLSFMNGNAHNFLAPLLTLIPKVGGGMFKIYEKWMELYEKYQKEHMAINEGSSEAILQIINRVKEEKGNPWEYDFFTELIVKFLTQIKEKLKETEEIETVLLIDDLDRMDPEHVFRILNVFGSHFESWRFQRHEENIQEIDEYANKFGFDKVIFVADIENLKEMFKYRYGSKVDTNGYFDKFYDSQIFEFDITEKIINSILKSMIESRSSCEYTLRSSLRSTAYTLLKDMIDNNLFSLRSLIKLIRLSPIEPFYSNPNGIHTKKEDLSELNWTNIYLLLVDLSGGVSELKHIFKSAIPKSRTLRGLTSNSLPGTRFSSTYLAEIIIPFLSSFRESDSDRVSHYNHSETKKKQIMILDSKIIYHINTADDTIITDYQCNIKNSVWEIFLEMVNIMDSDSVTMPRRL